MTEKRDLAEGLMLRVIYYLLTACCLFFVFLLTVTFTTDRIDTELVLTIIVAVLLITFMLNTSQRLAAIQRNMDMLIKQMKRNE